MKRLLICTFLGLSLISCTTSKNPTSNLIKHPELEMVYSQEAVEFFKEYNLHMRFGRKRFVVNTDIIQHDIDWVSFDNNKPVYQIDKSEDIRENSLKMNPHYLELDGVKYETDAPDNYFVIGNKLIHYRCLEQEYIPDFDRNECIERAIYANNNLVKSTDLAWSGTNRLKSIEMRFVKDSNLYFSIYTDEPHDFFDTDYTSNNKVYIYNASTGESELFADFNDWHIFDVKGKDYVSTTAGTDGNFLIGNERFNFDISDALVSNDQVYYIPLEDFETRIKKQPGAKSYVSLLRNKEKIASVFTDQTDFMLHIENGDRKKCMSYLDPLFTKPFCVIGSTYIAKSQVGHGGTKLIPDYEKELEDRDEYLINGTPLSFYPYFDVPDKYNSDIMKQYDGSESELVQGVGFLFSKNNEVERLLIVAEDPGISVNYKLYIADYLGNGKIGEPTFLMEYNGTLFGYTVKENS